MNILTGSWETMNTTGKPEAFGCGAVNGSQIYLFGGQQTDSVERFDPRWNTYDILQKMPDKVDQCAAAVLGGRVYVAGGHNQTGYRYNTKDDWLLNAGVHRYDSLTDQWSSVASMNRERYYHSLVALNGHLYAIGGAHTKKTAERYDPETDHWSFIANSTFEHHHSAAAVLGGKIYVYGGDGFEVYSPETDQWTQLSSDSDRKYGRTLLEVNGQLWATGGGHPASKEVFVYDVTSGQWTRKPDMDIARQDHLSFFVSH